MATEPDVGTARRRRRPVLAAALITPLVATLGVAVFASAPRSPVVYCRITSQFFNNLMYSGNVHRNGTDDAADAIVLVEEAGQEQAHAPSAMGPQWVLIRAAAMRLEATGEAATADQPQGRINDALRMAYQDYRTRCGALLSGLTVPPLDLGGLVGQPPAVAYCQRALTFFSDVVANSGDTDQFTRDRLLSEGERAASLSPSPPAGDWVSTVDALRRLQRTGSSSDAGHTQEAVNGALNRVADDYSARCPTPIPTSPG